MADYINPQVPIADQRGIMTLWFYKFLLSLSSTASSGAPTGASYITLGLNPTLTAERVLTAGANITFTDAGAGSTLTVAVTPSGAASRLLGRGSASSGDWQEITLGTNLAMSGTTLNATASTTVDYTTPFLLMGA